MLRVRLGSKLRRRQHAGSLARRLVDELDPETEIACLDAGGLVPRDPDRPQEPEEAKQVHRVGALGARRPAACLQLSQVGRDRVDHHAVSVDKLERLEVVRSRTERAAPGHDQFREVSQGVCWLGHGARP